MQKHSILYVWQGSKYACVQIASNNVLSHHNKRVMGYFESLYGLGIICLLLNFSEKLHWQHLIEKSEEAETHQFYLSPSRTASAIQRNRYHHHFFIWIPSCVWPRCDPFLRQNPWSGCNSRIDLVVALEYAFFQLCSNAKQIFVRLTRFRRSYVNYPVVVLTSPTSYKSFLLDYAAFSKVATFLFLQLFVPDDSIFA